MLRKAPSSWEVAPAVTRRLRRHASRGAFWLTSRASGAPDHSGGTVRDSHPLSSTTGRLLLFSPLYPPCSGQWGQALALKVRQGVFCGPKCTSMGVGIFINTPQRAFRATKHPKRHLSGRADHPPNAREAPSWGAPRMRMRSAAAYSALYISLSLSRWS